MIPSGNFILQTYRNENAFYTFKQQENCFQSTDKVEKNGTDDADYLIISAINNLYH